MDGAAACERARRPVASALDAGDISADHAKVILRALGDLPADVTDAERHTCECELVRLAGGRSPAQLRKAARRVIEVLKRDRAAVDGAENEIVAATEADARRRSAFWIKDNHDGTMTGQFTVPWLEGATLKKIIDSMTAPRRSSRSSTVRATEAGPDRGSVETGPVVGAREAGPGRGSREAGPDGDFVASMPGDAAAGCVPGDVMASAASVSRAEPEDWKDTQLDWQHRRGGAFADLLRRIPTDHLHPKTAATVLVSVDLETLTGEVQQVAETDVGDVVSAGEVRRLACESGIIPAVLGGESLPLDLGRQRRFHSEAQRMALSLLYDSCVAEGCDRPFAWGEIHHLTAWRDGGETRVDDGVPLCGTHHHWVDDPACSHEVVRDDAGRVTIRFRRRPKAA
ncbi:uncharacterized protein DUF222 [Knoellia remsis]|uniref:Uncharacterized protein DUF222 n=2 Tax=Knoellia remsis TaxID=407159 RepID=A0A2T0UA81_9MICO|nr:uncharacterized protein DUF222 [Knoellia remsis]